MPGTIGRPLGTRAGLTNLLPAMKNRSIRPCPTTARRRRAKAAVARATMTAGISGCPALGKGGRSGEASVPVVSAARSWSTMVGQVPVRAAPGPGGETGTRSLLIDAHGGASGSDPLAGPLDPGRGHREAAQHHDGRRPDEGGVPGRKGEPGPDGGREQEHSDGHDDRVVSDDPLVPLVRGELGQLRPLLPGPAFLVVAGRVVDPQPAVGAEPTVLGARVLAAGAGPGGAGWGRRTVEDGFGAGTADQKGPAEVAEAGQSSQKLPTRRAFVARLVHVA